MNRPRRRPHPAQGSRILAAGLSVSSMLGLSSAMAAAELSTEPVASTPVSAAVGAPVVSPRATAAPAPVKVVIVRKYVYAAPTSKPVRPTTARSAQVPVSKAKPAPQPVRVAAPAPADATSKGSG